MLDMLLSMLIQGGFKASVAIIAFLIVLAALRVMDKQLAGTTFGIMVNGWDDDSKSRYYAARLIAVGLLIGLALS